MEKFKNGQYYDVPTIKHACADLTTKGIDEKVAKEVGLSNEHIHQFEMTQFFK